MKKKHPLRFWRECEGITITDFAAHVGLSESFISMVETGQRGLSLSTAARLSNKTGIPLADFVREPA